MSNDETRTLVIAEARKWLGTPYKHQASVCGVGADCLGLIRGVWRQVVGPEPETLPAYSADWGEVDRNETVLAAGKKWLIARPLPTIQPGTVVVFRWKNAPIAKHAGILTDYGRFIHAYEKAGVVETTLGRQWRNRIVAAFAFPIS